MLVNPVFSNYVKKKSEEAHLGLKLATLASVDRALCSTSMQALSSSSHDAADLPMLVHGYVVAG